MRSCQPPPARSRKRKESNDEKQERTPLGYQPLDVVTEDPTIAAAAAEMAL